MLLRPRSGAPGKPSLSGESLENWLRLKGRSFGERVKLLTAFKDHPQSGTHYSNPSSPVNNQDPDLHSNPQPPP